MAEVTFAQLEQAFGAVIEKNRKRQTLTPCPPEALFAHAFFHLDEGEAPPPLLGLVPNKIPFEAIWMVTHYKGLGICAFVERMEVEGLETLRPDYLWYPVAIPGHRVHTTEAEMDSMASFLIDRAIWSLLSNDLQEVDSPVQASINRGRAKARNNPIPDLPAFIRIAKTLPPRSGPQGGKHASPQPHDRRGHWRTYRASGKTVRINETKVRGGSPVPRTYISAGAVNPHS